MFTGIHLLQRNVWDFFSTKDIFGKFVEFNLLKGGAECSACEVNSMIKKRVRTMSFQPRKHSGMQQLYHIGYTYGVNLLLTFLYHFCDLGKTYYRGSPTYMKIINTVSATTVLSLCTCKWGIFALVADPLQSH